MSGEMRNDGVPTEPGWYWVTRPSTNCVAIVEVRANCGSELYCVGDRFSSLEEVGHKWQRVKPFDEIPMCECGKPQNKSKSGEYFGCCNDCLLF